MTGPPRGGIASLCRPAAVPAGARPHPVGVPGLVPAARFLEAETPALQVSPGNEVHLHAFATELTTPGGGRTPLYLHTSPEFTCKKLLAAARPGCSASPTSFATANEATAPSRIHHAGMVPDQRAYEALMEDCAALLAEAAKAAGALRLQWKDRSCDPYAKPERLSVGDAFRRWAGIDLLATLTSAEPDAADLRPQPRRPACRCGRRHLVDIFSRVLVERVEPRLGQDHAVLLDRYPLPEAAWAQTGR